MTDLIKPKDYNDILSAIISALTASGVFKSGAKIEMAPGTLTEGWIAQASIPNAGGAFVALGRLLSVNRRSDGMQEHLLNLGLFAVSPYGARSRQAQDLNALVFDLSRLIEDNRFGLELASKPSSFTGRNLYSQSLMKKGSALWALEWRQSFVLFDEKGLRTGARVAAALGRETNWPLSEAMPPEVAS